VPDGEGCRRTEELLNQLTQEQLSTLRAVFVLAKLSLADCQDCVEALGGRVEKRHKSWIFDFPQLEHEILYTKPYFFGDADKQFVRDLRSTLRKLGIDDDCL
jgi:hypothetical protein